MENKDYLTHLRSVFYRWSKFNLSSDKKLYIQSIFLVIYFVIRQMVGVQPVFILVCVLILIALKIPLARIILLFFIMTIISVTLGRYTEANYYLSRMFLLLVLLVIVEMIALFTKDNHFRL